MPWLPEAHERLEPEGEPPPGRPWPRDLKRAARALGIIAKVQDAADDLGETPARDEFLAEVWTAARAPFRPGAHAILSPHARHCRDWPSPETWQMVAELGTRFEVVRIGEDPP